MSVGYIVFYLYPVQIAVSCATIRRSYLYWLNLFTVKQPLEPTFQKTGSWINALTYQVSNLAVFIFVSTSHQDSVFLFAFFLQFVFRGQTRFCAFPSMHVANSWLQANIFEK